MAVTPENIATALGKDAPEEGTPKRAQWAMWIADALMLITDRLGNLDDLIAAGKLEQAKLDYVVREAVVAHIRRPDDATTVTAAIDDGSTSKTYRSARGRIHIIEEWWDLLSPKDARRAFGIDTAPASRGGHAPFCASMFRATYCDCGTAIAGRPIYYAEQEF